MTLLAGIQIANALLATVQELQQAHRGILETVEAARLEGREHFTAEEWARITALDDGARAQLAAAIARAKAAGATG
jgi:hypothetical protein